MGLATIAFFTAERLLMSDFFWIAMMFLLFDFDLSAPSEPLSADVVLSYCKAIANLGRSLQIRGKDNFSASCDW